MSAHPMDTQSDVCRLLGGLLLDGANIELLRVLGRDRTMHHMSAEGPVELGEVLEAMQEALGDDGPEAVASEYTRLFVATTEDGKRRPLLVPPWEDCWLGSERRVLGERSRAVLLAYVAAGLGFDAMKERPADHIGLEMCFVATLRDEEAQAERDASAHDAFVRDHLAPLSERIGEALAREARGAFWRETGRILQVLPAAFGWPPPERANRSLGGRGSCPQYCPSAAAERGRDGP